MTSILLLFLYLSANAQSAKISNVNVRHNVEKDSNKGMSISFRVDVNGMKSRKTEILAWFYDRNGDTRTKNYGGVSGYRANDNHSVVFATVTPQYDNTYWEYFVLFMPYSALAHKSGENKYSFKVEVREDDSSTKLGGSSYYDFSVNYGNETKQYASSNSNSKSHSDVIHTHTDMSDGGYIDTYTYQDGRTFTVTSQPCTYCGQTGKCQICHGAGQTFVVAGYYSTYVPCTICGMTGKCPLCGGSGVNTSQNWIDSKTGAYTATSGNGFVSSGYVTGSSDEDSRETSYSSSTKSSSRDYIWVKEYAPDYTGDAEKVWCDKCNKRDYPHVHVKKFH